MARKNTVTKQLVSAQSLTTSFTTAPTLIKYLDNVSYQVNVTTTNSVGSFSVEASVDYAMAEVTDVVVNPGTWVTLTLSGTPTVNAANDSILLDLNQLPFNAVRLAYTASTPGTGTAAVYIQARQLGG